MPHLRLPIFVALAFALVFVTLAHATEEPFQVFAATGG